MQAASHCGGRGAGGLVIYLRLNAGAFVCASTGGCAAIGPAVVVGVVGGGARSRDALLIRDYFGGKHVSCHWHLR